LALVLVSLIEDRLLVIDKDSDALSLAIEKRCTLDIVMMLCQVGFKVRENDLLRCKKDK